VSANCQRDRSTKASVGIMDCRLLYAGLQEAA
jgi:hypothetical protein